jgi:GT2 family glycosyltransferase
MQESKKAQPKNIICKKVAVVVLGYNSLDLLKKFLPTLAKTKYEDHTLVYVDNGSDDDSVAYVTEHFPEVEIFRIYDNKGFANGYQESLPYIKAEYYVLVNSDVAVTEGWLGILMEEMEKDPQVGICQPKLLHEPKPELFDYAGAAGGFMDRFCYPFCRGRLFHHIEADKNQYDDVCEVFWASGSCMLIRSELFHKFGGLDESFYAHMEEIDLCWRIKNAGYKILAVPKSVVYHVGGSVITYGSFSKIYHNYRNSLVMMVKNLNFWKLFLLLPIRIVLDQVAALKALFTGNFIEFRAIIVGDFNFIFGINKWMKARKFSRKHVSSPNLKGWYKKSLIIDVFIKKKSKFSELNLN